MANAYVKLLRDLNGVETGYTVITILDETGTRVSGSRDIGAADTDAAIGEAVRYAMQYQAPAPE